MVSHGRARSGSALLALSAQLLGQAHGVEQHEVKVVVDGLSIDAAGMNLFCAGWLVGFADRHCDTTASTPSGSDRSADVAEPDTVVVGMPGGYSQFVTAVAEVEATGRL